MGSCSKALLQTMFDSRRLIMDLVKRQVAVHTAVNLNSNAITYAACAQVMRLDHVGKRLDDVCDLLLGLLWQRTFRQFVYARMKQPYGHLNQYETYND